MNITFIGNDVRNIIAFWKTLLSCLINSSPLSAAYMCLWIVSAMVQIMACHLLSDKPLSKPSCVIVNWTLRNKLQCNFHQNTNFFFHGDASQFSKYHLRNGGHFVQVEINREISNKSFPNHCWHISLIQKYIYFSRPCRTDLLRPKSIRELDH